MLFSSIYSIFIDTNNTAYISDAGKGAIQVWAEGMNQSIRTISVTFGKAYTTFVTFNGDIYAGDSNQGQVRRWLPNATDSVSAMLIREDCWGLFIDILNTLYCSVGYHHHVVSMPLSDTRNTLTLVAGKSCAGSTADTFNGPSGVFVDLDLKLYVADWGNSRIQLFHQGQVNATTVAGSGASGTIDLYHPEHIILDYDGYVFIADAGNNRIVGSGPNGFRCVVGCSGIAGAAADQFSYPQTLAFDSFGNIWAVDQLNGRVQKFVLDTGSCSKYWMGLLQNGTRSLVEIRLYIFSYYRYYFSHR